jgi:putative transposase
MIIGFGCRREPCRPGVTAEIRKVVRAISASNPLWGAPRIHGELLKLGFGISERTVSRLMRRTGREPRSQTWKTFLANHLGGMVSIDFFTVPTIGLRVLYVLVVLHHERRRVIHFNVTANPTAAWAGQQIVEAFPEDSSPRYMIRDRDGTERISERDSPPWISARFSPRRRDLAKCLRGTADRHDSPRVP